MNVCAGTRLCRDHTGKKNMWLTFQYTGTNVTIFHIVDTMRERKDKER